MQFTKRLIEEAKQMNVTPEWLYNYRRKSPVIPAFTNKLREIFESENITIYSRGSGYYYVEFGFKVKSLYIDYCGFVTYGKHSQNFSENSILTVVTEDKTVWMMINNKQIYVTDRQDDVFAKMYRIKQVNSN